MLQRNQMPGFGVITLVKFFSMKNLFLRKSIFLCFNANDSMVAKILKGNKGIF